MTTDFEQAPERWPQFLTQDEAAAAIGKSRRFVVELRLGGRLPYLPGQPPLIERDDLLAWLRKPTERKPPVRIADARKWAQIAVLLRRRKS